MKYNSVIIGAAFSAATDLARLTEYEAAGAMLRAADHMAAEEDYQPIVSLLRGVEDDCVTSEGKQIAQRILRGFNAALSFDKNIQIERIEK